MDQRTKEELELDLKHTIWALENDYMLLENTSKNIESQTRKLNNIKEELKLHIIKRQVLEELIKNCK